MRTDWQPIADRQLQERAEHVMHELIGNSFSIERTGAQNGWEEKLAGTLTEGAHVIQALLSALHWLPLPPSPDAQKEEKG